MTALTEIFVTAIIFVIIFGVLFLCVKECLA